MADACTGAVPPEKLVAKTAHYEQGDGDLVAETVLYDHIGSYSVLQVTPKEHLSKCLAVNSQRDDSTGLRAYSGSQVMVPFVCSPDIVRLTARMNVLEVGCGTGVVGLIGFLHADYSKLVLSDGSANACAICEKNIDHLVPNRRNDDTIHCREFLWGQSAEYDADFMACCNGGDRFDVVMGCELMYFRTDVTELLSSVTRLLAETGLLIHSHHFRLSGQEEEIIEYFHQRGWRTALVPNACILTEASVREHPEWTDTLCLVSCASAVMEELCATHTHWVDFDAHMNQKRRHEADENMIESGAQPEEDDGLLPAGLFTHMKS